MEPGWNIVQNRGGVPFKIRVATEADKPAPVNAPTHIGGECFVEETSKLYSQTATGWKLIAGGDEGQIVLADALPPNRNYVVEGGATPAVPAPASFTLQFPATEVWLLGNTEGVKRSFAAFSHTFAANTNTLVNIAKDGTLSFPSAVAPAYPAAPDDDTTWSMWSVETDATGVTYVSYAYYDDVRYLAGFINGQPTRGMLLARRSSLPATCPPWWVLNIINDQALYYNTGNRDAPDYRRIGPGVDVRTDDPPIGFGADGYGWIRLSLDDPDLRFYVDGEAVSIGARRANTVLSLQPAMDASGLVVYSNLPAEQTEWMNGLALHRSRADLRNYKEVRLNAMIGVDTGLVTAELLVQWTPADNPGVWNWLGDVVIGPYVSLEAGLGGQRSSGWQILSDAAKGDVLLRLVTRFGDGVVDPSFGRIQVECR